MANRVVVITGASSGIGAACARAFASHGCRLALGARRTDRLASLARELEGLGSPQVWSGWLDVRDGRSITNFHRDVVNNFGRVDVLINNAGLAAGLDPVSTGEDADWEAMLDTNVLGLLKVTRAFLPDMVTRQRGHIINLGSIAGLQTYAKGAAYAGSKHAVRAISGALRLELIGAGIRVTEIDPGMVETEFSLVRLKDPKKANAVYAGMTPLTAEDIADTIMFAANRPSHVNIDQIVLMPTDQAAATQVYRRPQA
ncbi:MAG: SDR family NAD(P)-dependent oxidoreductase [Deltaproteobacteria bacterium]|nr:SDR family NAD(P)-dependent oxidoreductase [Deltaproteobacteria bacterium]